MSFTYHYPHMAVTADAVILTRSQPRKVLLVQRGGPPFKGMWAIPGGYVDLDERIETAAARELAEETGLRIGALRFLGYFDAVDRDPRERTLSLAFWGMVADEHASPLAAGDDAKALGWHLVGRLPAMAFDHAEILRAAIEAAA
ncbi:MAG TPA: NUDIX hydrolase [Phenylobacterium sp.]|jgi:8-oxo-dGTP diphosphatase|nr:NUDIX hydrolase [Phenylobacterium sp.]